MKNAPDRDWQPDQQLLGAYFDGELEGRDDLADLCARLELWLDEHPEAAHEWVKHQQLRKLWIDTTPAEPRGDMWNETLERIDAQRKQPTEIPRAKYAWVPASLVAASIALVFGMAFGALRFLTQTSQSEEASAVPLKEKPIKPEADTEVFPVATAEEVVIRRVEGADTSLLVVGRLPINGPLELAAPGEIRVVYVRPDASDQMMPTVHEHGPRPPMIWAKIDQREW